MQYRPSDCMSPRLDGRVALRIGDTPWSLTTGGIGVCLALLNAVGAVTLDRPDVQFAREISWPPASAQLLDFGAIRVEERFDYPLSSGAGVTLNRIQWPGTPDFVQPDANLCLSVDSGAARTLSNLRHLGAAVAFRPRYRLSNFASGSRDYSTGWSATGPMRRHRCKRTLAIPMRTNVNAGPNT